FLDEIGELSLDLQAKLLQFIQNKSFRKLGSNKSESTDIRILAATNRDIRKMIEEGKFIEDLYYRLSTIPIIIPPLRERKDDLMELTFYLLNQINSTYNTNKVFSTKTINQIIKNEWPGNVSQLRNIIERLVV